MVKERQADGPRIGWKSATRDPSIASFRFRVAAPVGLLRARGRQVELVDADGLDACDIVVFSKTYGRADQAAARAVRGRGGKVIFDLCDNHFYNPFGLPRYDRAREDILAMMALTDTVICTTSALAEVIHAETAGAVSAVVVADLPERPILPVRAERRPGAPLDLLWFGSHGSPNASSGMSDILLIRAELEALAAGGRASLTVCSNNRDKFDAEIAPMRMPTRYVEWSEAAYLWALGEADAVILPITINPFTACKSHNRLTSALYVGKPTLATTIESYRELGAYCRLDAWSDGLAGLLDDYEGESVRARSARDFIDAVWSTEAISTRWEDALGL